MRRCREWPQAGKRSAFPETAAGSSHGNGGGGGCSTKNDGSIIYRRRVLKKPMDDMSLFSAACRFHYHALWYRHISVNSIWHIYAPRDVVFDVQFKRSMPGNNIERFSGELLSVTGYMPCPAAVARHYSPRRPTTLMIWSIYATPQHALLPYINI